MREAGGVEAGRHRMALRVYYEDTDAAGIVYHAAYLAFAERARTEMLRCLGLDHRTLHARFGVVFTVRRCIIDYLAPARLDDLLEVRTRSSARAAPRSIWISGFYAEDSGWLFWRCGSRCSGPICGSRGCRDRSPRRSPGSRTRDKGLPG